MRIIPALAGNTGTTPTRSTNNTDHPRSRGEYNSGHVKNDWVAGSSPLSRGIPCRRSRGRADVGIIPALAGNTHQYSARGRIPGDHPRSRGEYAIHFYKYGRHEGSSPLSRGIPTQARVQATYIRIIPALAGNTRTATPKTRSVADHPRSRGEYRPSASVTVSENGSSPLSRGILGVVHRGRRCRRIIPALAGNTYPGRCCGHYHWDHPRSRGEYQ